MNRLPNREYLKRRPQLLLLTVLILGLLVIIFDTLEDTSIEGGPFTGTPIDIALNVIIAITQNVTATVSSWGYVGILFLMLLESSSLPIPSEVILPFAGYLVSQGQLSLYATILVATIAGIAGSMIDYYIGLKGSKILTQQKALDKILHIKGTLQTADSWFKKYGSAAVFLSRMAPGFRTLISFPAGAARMPLYKFVIYTTAGCLLWNITLIEIGAYLGSNWRLVAGLSRYLIIIVLAATLLLLLFWSIKNKKRRNAETKYTQEIEKTNSQAFNLT